MYLRVCVTLVLQPSDLIRDALAFCIANGFLLCPCAFCGWSWIGSGEDVVEIRAMEKIAGRVTSGGLPKPGGTDSVLTCLKPLFIMALSQGYSNLASLIVETNYHMYKASLLE